jgi:hypothetical protein
MDWRDYTGLGLGAVGVGYGGYEWWRTNDLRKHWGDIVADTDTMLGYIDQYVLGVNELIAKFNTAAASGVPVDNEEVNREVAELSNLEHLIEHQLEIIYTDIGKAKEDAENDWVSWLWAHLPPSVKALIGLGVIIGGIAIAFATVAVGLFVARVIKNITDFWHNNNRPTGTAAGCPSCNATITAANAQELRMNVERHLATHHPVNVNAMVQVLPDARAKFAQLPEWVQESVAVDTGIEGFFYQPDWRPYLMQTPWKVYAIIACVVVLAVGVAIVAPGLVPVLAKVGTALAPALLA